MNTVVVLGFLMNQTPLELFKHGGPIMWPIALVSFIGVTVAIERVLFIIREERRRDPELVDRMIARVEAGEIEKAIEMGKDSKDFVARVIIEALQEREVSFTDAYIRASHRELARFSQGLSILDTAITAAPLLGLLGTVTGMMATFGSMQGDIGAAAGAITGGVAEALIATASGLAIAICGLLPFNYMNAKIENARHDVEDTANALNAYFAKTGTN
ncbi:MAG TPA: MotA/TolQ/ExbB proton channel family protein [Opitutaceae bacterium]